MSNNSAECFVGSFRRFFSLECCNCGANGTRGPPTVRSTVEIGRWQVDSGQARSSCGSNPFSAIATCRSTSSEGCNVVKDNTWAQVHADRRRARIEQSHRVTPQGAERKDRRCAVICEALAEEIERNNQKEERGSRGTPAASLTKAAAPATPEKRGRLRKSQTATQQKYHWRSTMAHETRCPASWDGESRRKKTSVRSSNEQFCCGSHYSWSSLTGILWGKQRGIASVQQIELNLMELSVTRHVLKKKKRKTIKPLKRSTAEQSRWMELEESQSSDSYQAPA